MLFRSPLAYVSGLESHAISRAFFVCSRWCRSVTRACCPPHLGRSVASTRVATANPPVSLSTSSAFARCSLARPLSRFAFAGSASSECGRFVLAAYHRQQQHRQRQQQQQCCAGSLVASCRDRCNWCSQGANPEGMLPCHAKSSHTVHDSARYVCVAITNLPAAATPPR